MNKQDIQNLIQEMIAQNMNTNQFNYSKVPNHVHNGIDSPRIGLGDNIMNNQSRPMYSFISGLVTLSGGTATVTDERITTDSVIVVTSQTSHSFTGSGNSVSAFCSNGSATISGTTTEIINYLIII